MGLIKQLENLKTIFITVDDEDEAYVIFEILNSKGHDLENIDLIKNLIFKMVNDVHPIDEAKNTWNEIKGELSKRQYQLDIDTYFRNYWLSKKGHITKTKLYESVKKTINNEKEANELLTDLLNKVELYQKICNPQPNDWTDPRQKKIYECAHTLNIFGVYTPRPLLFSLLIKFCEGKKTIKIKELEDVLNSIENFHFIFTAISSKRASGLDSMYAKYAKKIYDSSNRNDVKKVLDEFKKILKSKLPTEKEFSDAFVKLYYTNENTKYKKLIQYIFQKWESYLRKTDELYVKNFTIEHIKPQSDGDDFIAFIGNLLPINGLINNQLDTKPFREKLTIMKNSELYVVKDFIKNNSRKMKWEAKEIQVRGRSMARIAYNNIWVL